MFSSSFPPSVARPALPGFRLRHSLTALLLFLSGCAAGEPVTERSLSEAKHRWEKADVRDYDLEWTSSGPSPAHYFVTVRDGSVRTLEGVGRDGVRRQVKPAEPEFYGVPGLFRVIAEELGQLDTPAPFGRPKEELRGNSVVLRFDPDPTYGYPRSYRRDAVGTPMALGIDVLRFTPSPRTARPRG